VAAVGGAGTAVAGGGETAGSGVVGLGVEFVEQGEDGRLTAGGGVSLLGDEGLELVERGWSEVGPVGRVDGAVLDAGEVVEDVPAELSVPVGEIVAPVRVLGVALAGLAVAAVACLVPLVRGQITAVADSSRASARSFLPSSRVPW
jgi:hypothetical protein